MDEEDAKKFLSIEDYVIIAVAMVISAGIGLYFRLSGGKQKTEEEYLLAGKNMSVLPVSFSIMATFLSTATLMGIPTDVYLYGTHMAFFNIGIIIAVVAASYIFIPVYFNANVTTSYEYIEKRFGSLARTLCSLCFTVKETLFLGVILYTPALALSAVTNLSTWSSVIAIGTVCTFYCTLGGMKAVLWTDMFQALLMFACLFTIIIKGCIDFGGFHEIFKLASEGGRLVVPSMSMNFSLRYTMWNIILQAFCICFVTFGTSQLQVQRLLSVKNSSRARKAMIGSVPLVVSFQLMCCLCGVIFFATFFYCDPLSMPGTPIHSADQIMPYYIMHNLREFPGLPGLCICGIFAASLSTVSSLIQTLTVVTIEHFLHPFCSIWGIKIFTSIFSAKAITCFFGALGIFLAFVVAAMGNVVEVTISLFGLLGGPLLGLFFLAVLTKTANEKGAIIGMISSFALVTWFTFGPFLASTHGKLPLSTSGCLIPANEVEVPLFVIRSMNEITNTTEVSYLTTISLNSTESAFLKPTITAEISLPDISNMNEIANTTEFSDYTTFLRNSTESKTLHFSHMWITPIGAVTSFILGYICSLFIKYVTGNEDQVDTQLLSPVWHCFMGKRREVKQAKNQEQMRNETTTL